MKSTWSLQDKQQQHERKKKERKQLTIEPQT